MSVALAKVREKRILWVFGTLLVITITYLAWPRPFQPPLRGLGNPVWQGKSGITDRYIYSIPADHWSYAPTAISILARQGFKRTNNDLNWFRHPDGRSVIIYSGRWKPWRTHDGMVDTFVEGWVTVTCSTPPNRLQQLWLQYKLGSKMPRKVATSTSSP